MILFTFGPAFRYIFFVVANKKKSFVETFLNRNNKKGCRYNQGYFSNFGDSFEDLIKNL